MALPRKRYRLFLRIFGKIAKHKGKQQDSKINKLDTPAGNLPWTITMFGKSSINGPGSSIFHSYVNFQAGISSVYPRSDDGFMLRMDSIQPVGPVSGGEIDHQLENEALEMGEAC